MVKFTRKKYSNLEETISVDVFLHNTGIEIAKIAVNILEKSRLNVFNLVKK